jgi:hypothetical protein
MLRSAFLFLLLVSATSIAHRDDNDFGNAYHNGKAEVYHDGDYVEFSIQFESRCLNDRLNAWNYVANNVETFSNWLNNERINYQGGSFNYVVEPLNIWQKNKDHYSYDAEDSCADTYYARQTLKITVHKSEGIVALSGDAIQSFYNQIQRQVWALNTNNNVNTTVTNIEKGIYEQTADELRRLAKAKALDKAKKDFLFFLGADYEGTWYLQSVDFREGSHNYAELRSSVDSIAPVVFPAPPGVEEPAFSVLKLEPLTFNVSGQFHFVYELKYWH